MIDLSENFIKIKRKIYLWTFPIIIFTALFSLIDEVKQGRIDFEMVMISTTVIIFSVAFICILISPKYIGEIEIPMLISISFLHFVKFFKSIHFDVFLNGDQTLGNFILWSPLFYLYILFVLDGKKKNWFPFIYSILICFGTIIIGVAEILYFRYVHNIQLTGNLIKEVIQYYSSSLAFVIALYGVYTFKNSYLKTETLKELANLDGLTGVANRRRIEEMIQKYDINPEISRPLSLVLIDIDHFKQYNDTYGHIEGDTCLRKIAKTIDNTVIIEGSLVGRYGGEEFLVILPRTDKEEASSIAEDIKRNIDVLQIPHSNSDIAPIVTLSMGISTLYADNPLKNTYDTLHEADEALYKVKRTSKNGIKLYECESSKEEELEIAK